MSHATHKHETCHRIRIRHVTRAYESCRTYEWVMSNIWVSHIAHTKESCHKFEWVMSHIPTRLIETMNESYYTRNMPKTTREPNARGSTQKWRMSRLPISYSSIPCVCVYTYICIYVYMYICIYVNICGNVCMRLCVSIWDRREAARKSDEWVDCLSHIRRIWDRQSTHSQHAKVSSKWAMAHSLALICEWVMLHSYVSESCEWVMSRSCVCESCCTHMWVSHVALIC